jgi:hypothetical protein
MAWYSFFAMLLPSRCKKAPTSTFTNPPVAELWCHKHNKQIVRLDAFYPYHSEKNCCEECLRLQQPKR